MSDDATDDDGVLTPDELDVGRDERVEELDGNRYFVSIGDDPSAEERGNPRPDGSDDVRDAPSAENAGDERDGAFDDGPETGFDPDRVLDDAAAVESDGRRGSDGGVGRGDADGSGNVDPDRDHGPTAGQYPGPDPAAGEARTAAGDDRTVDGLSDDPDADSNRSTESRAGTPVEPALADVDGQFAVAAALRTDADVAEYRFGSNNVAETFEALVQWYADRVGDGRTPTEEVVRILLAESDLEP